VLTAGAQRRNSALRLSLKKDQVVIDNAKPVRVLVVGLGTMGLSHARAYHKNPGFELVGLCTHRAAERSDLAREFPEVPRFDEFTEALTALRPDAVAVCTYTEAHADLAVQAFAAGAHVFCEKPLAETMEAAERVVAAARASGKALLIGYILRVHPSWKRFVEIGRTLGKPLAMRMNLNQQSFGSYWSVHKNLMRTTSPIVDCGVHYVDMMCLVTQAKPVSVHAVGVRMTDEIAPGMYNYGHLHIVFSDGSVGWYEAGWGPMMSETAYFVKDMIGPKGSVSIVAKESAGAAPSSASHDGHARTNALRLHHAALKADGTFAEPDEIIATADEPDHQALCDLEQQSFLEAIREGRDLSAHHEDALNSLRIVFAADESVRTGEVVRL
jgi:predicted dehydrogenase